MLPDLVTFGTDGEHSLSEALSTCFSKALHLCCFRHFEGNVRSILSQLHVTDCRQYLSEIFGKQEGRQKRRTVEVSRLDERKGFLNEKLYDSRCAHEGGARFFS